MIFIITIIALTLGFTIGSRHKQNKLMSDIEISKAVLRLKNREIENLKRGIIKC